MMGDYLLIHLYAKITNVSEAVALQSFGFLESALLAVIIYWVLYKITRRHATGIFGGLSFALLYAFLPLSLDLLAQQKSVFSALIIALPTMLFSIFPQTFRFHKKTATLILIILFLAVLFIDLFVGLLIMLPFLFLVSIFRFWQNKRQVLLVLSSYIIAVSILFAFYMGVAWWFNENLTGFINANLFSYDAYTYNPKLILPLNELMGYYMIAGIVFLGIGFFKFAKRPKKYQTTLIFLIFINFLFAVNHFAGTLIDIDILNMVLSVFIPIFFGLILNIIINLLSSLNVPGRLAINVEVGSGLLVIAALVFFTFPAEAKLTLEKNKLESHVFRIYSKIQGNHLPYSYAVINSSRNSSFSKESHYFYSYDYFNKKYIARDRAFQLYKNNESYLLDHPNLFLPEALFIFIYKKEGDGFSKNNITEEQQETAKNRIKLLRAKGREISVYYDSEDLRVYQVVNKAKSSNIQELLF
jgi:MFS family permease